jgi:hypothetical protein
MATKNPRFRRLPIGRYLLDYDVKGVEVIVHYVRHGARQRPWEGEEG